MKYRLTRDNVLEIQAAMADPANVPIKQLLRSAALLYAAGWINLLRLVGFQKSDELAQRKAWALGGDLRNIAVAGIVSWAKMEAFIVGDPVTATLERVRAAAAAAGAIIASPFELLWRWAVGLVLGLVIVIALIWGVTRVIRS